jgi:hypothetical protein
MKKINLIILIILVCSITANLTFLITYQVLGDYKPKLKFVNKDDLTYQYSETCKNQNVNSTVDISKFVNNYKKINNVNINDIISEINNLFPDQKTKIESFLNLNLCHMVYNKNMVVNKLNLFLNNIIAVEKNRIEFNFLKNFIKNLIKNIDSDIGESVKTITCFFMDKKFKIEYDEQSKVDQFIYKVINSKFEYSFRYLIKYLVNIKNTKNIKIGNFKINLDNYLINNNGLDQKQKDFSQNDVLTEIYMYHLMVIFNWFLLDMFDLFYELKCFSYIRGHLVNLKEFSEKFINQYSEENF